MTAATQSDLLTIRDLTIVTNTHTTHGAHDHAA